MGVVINNEYLITLFLSICFTVASNDGSKL